MNIEVILLDAQKFSVWKPVTKEIIFTLDSSVRPGRYSFMIMLSDGFDNEFFPRYVEVLPNTAPYFIDELLSPVYKFRSGV